MPKKILNNIITIVIAGVLLIIGLHGNAQQVKTYTIPEHEVKKYHQLNDQEIRLGEYKDDKSVLLIKLNQLAHINASRKKYRKPPVQLDILASRVANKIAKEAALGNFMGHFNTRGEKPYHRYAFAGGTAHVSENASALSSSEHLASAPKDIAAYMQQAHNAFMAERAPNDGHKQNCIDPNHNSVGLGFHLHKGQFRYYEEFLDLYMTTGDFKTTVTANEKFKIPVKPIKGKYVHMILAYYEKFPNPMSASAINRQMKYDDYTNDLAYKILPWELPKPNARGFTELAFDFKKKGLYYIQIYLDDKPYTSGSASTKNKIQASGIVITVN
ncbi:CAP domain-containing protein [Saccharicrinis sp. GN24d3]|uniref:CAP domain-containing protein n=1 Tax=Saccharicrinis sp. GN24d3 TaxID=3458416 RepID=UPI004035CF07